MTCTHYVHGWLQHFSPNTIILHQGAEVSWTCCCSYPESTTAHQSLAIQLGVKICNNACFVERPKTTSTSLRRWSSLKHTYTSKNHCRPIFFSQSVTVDEGFSLLKLKLKNLVDSILVLVSYISCRVLYCLACVSKISFSTKRRYQSATGIGHIYGAVLNKTAR